MPWWKIEIDQVDHWNPDLVKGRMIVGDATAKVGKMRALPHSIGRSKEGTAPVLFCYRSARPGLRTSSFLAVSARKIPIGLSSTRKTSTGLRYKRVIFPMPLTRPVAGPVQPNAERGQTLLSRKNFPTTVPLPESYNRK